MLPMALVFLRKLKKVTTKLKRLLMISLMIVMLLNRSKKVMKKLKLPSMIYLLTVAVMFLRK